jgi:hypothetical protein
MTEHKFRVGQLVRLSLGDETTATDLYEIVHVLPASPDRELQYRLRGIYEWHERVAAGRQITRAVQANRGGATGNRPG